MIFVNSRWRKIILHFWADYYFSGQMVTMMYQCNFMDDPSSKDLINCVFKNLGTSVNCSYQIKLLQLSGFSDKIAGINQNICQYI